MDALDRKTPEPEPSPTPIRVYHWTSKEAYKQMLEGGSGYVMKDPRTGKHVNSDDVRGLWPNERAVPIFMSGGLGIQASEPCIYALLEQNDQNWKANNRMWNDLMRHTKGEVMLEITLTEEQIDKTFVVEAQYYASGQHKDQEMYRKYWESRIPIREYLNGERRYILPEVIIQDRIDAENLKVIETNQVPPHSPPQE